MINRKVYKILTFQTIKISMNNLLLSSLFLILIFKFIIIIIARIFLLFIIWCSFLSLWFTHIVRILVWWCRHGLLSLMLFVFWGTCYFKVDLHIVWKWLFFTVFSSCGFADKEAFLGLISIWIIFICKFHLLDCIS